MDPVSTTETFAPEASIFEAYDSFEPIFTEPELEAYEDLFQQEPAAKTFDPSEELFGPKKSVAENLFGSIGIKATVIEDERSLVPFEDKALANQESGLHESEDNLQLGSAKPEIEIIFPERKELPEPRKEPLVIEGKYKVLEWLDEKLTDVAALNEQADHNLLELSSETQRLEEEFTSSLGLDNSKVKVFNLPTSSDEEPEIVGATISSNQETVGMKALIQTDEILVVPENLENPNGTALKVLRKFHKAPANNNIRTTVNTSTSSGRPTGVGPMFGNPKKPKEFLDPEETLDLIASIDPEATMEEVTSLQFTIRKIQKLILNEELDFEEKILEITNLLNNYDSNLPDYGIAFSINGVGAYFTKGSSVIAVETDGQTAYMLGRDVFYPTDSVVTVATNLNPSDNLSTTRLTQAYQNGTYAKTSMSGDELQSDPFINLDFADPFVDEPLWEPIV